jgi:hypothetical protein
VKKFIYTLLSLILATIAAYAVWVQFPKLKNKNLVQSALNSAQARFDNLQAEASNPEENGYLAASFLPYWGRDGQERQPGSPAERTIENWKQYASVSQDTVIDHKLLRREEDSSYLQALQQFEQLAPELKTAMQKPVFVTPSSDLNMDYTLSNIVAIRACGQAMTGLAESLLARAQPAEALDCLVCTLELGQALHSNEFLIYDLMAGGIQAMAFQVFVGLVDPEQTNLQADLWTELTRRVVASVPPKDSFAHSIEAEMTAYRNTMENLDKTEYVEFRQLDLLPGFLAREDRIYMNIMSDLLLQIQNQGTTNVLSVLGQPTAYDWFSGHTGIMAQIMVPNFDRLGQNIMLNRARMVGLATVFGVLTYRASEGRLPQTLSDLEKSQIAVVDADSLNALTYKVDGKTATLKVPLQKPPASNPWLQADLWDHPWCEGNNDFFVYKFGPRASFEKQPPEVEPEEK